MSSCARSWVRSSAASRATRAVSKKSKRWSSVTACPDSSTDKRSRCRRRFSVTSTSGLRNGTPPAARGVCSRATRRSGRAATKRAGSAGSASSRSSSTTCRPCGVCRRKRAGRLHARAAARHGRLEPVPRGVEGDVRPRRRLARAARPRLDRPGAGAARSRTRSTSTKTLFIVSSKSGSTLEPNIFKAYFFDRVKQAVGADKAASRFVAVTDPGSNLEKDAKADGFRHIFPGVKSIGGRYSALSNFGMVPAAVMGLDVEQLLDEAERMLHACAPGVPAAENPGLVLGTILGVAANAGHRQADDRRLARHPRPRRLARAAHRRVHGQGRQGHHPGRSRARSAPPDVYGDDRLFAYLRLEDAPDAAQDAAIAALEKAGQPVVTHPRRRRSTTWPRSSSAGRSRRRSRARSSASTRSTSPTSRPARSRHARSPTEYEKTGTLPAEAPFFEGDGVKLFADADERRGAAEGARARRRRWARIVKAHLDRLGHGRLLRAARLRRR